MVARNNEVITVNYYKWTSARAAGGAAHLAPKCGIGGDVGPRICAVWWTDGFSTRASHSERDLGIHRIHISAKLIKMVHLELSAKLLTPCSVESLRLPGHTLEWPILKDQMYPTRQEEDHVV